MVQDAAQSSSSYGPQALLPDAVLSTYMKCIGTKQVLYYPSEVQKEDNILKTEIRLCESLAKKPGPTPSQLRSALARVEGSSNSSSNNISKTGSPGTSSANGGGDSSTSKDNNNAAQAAAAEELRKKLEQEETKQSNKDDAKPKDVFAPENWDSLLVGEFDGGAGEKFGWLLNKYAVVPLHFLLVTKHWEHQTSPLTPPQLLAAYQTLSLFASTPSHRLASSQSNIPAPSSSESAGSGSTTSQDSLQVGGELLCFFNCGTESGASQEHKHLQFAPMSGEGSIGHFPVERAAESISFPDERSSEKPFSLEILPYAHHIRRLNPPNVPTQIELKGKSQEEVEDAWGPLLAYLQEAYLCLLDAMMDNLRVLHEADGGNTMDANSIRLGRGGLSYNMLLTRKHMHLIPRKESMFRIEASQGDNDGNDDGAAAAEACIIGCNALAYTGTVLVKSAKDSKTLANQGGVLKALEHCGFPKSGNDMPGISDDAL